MRLLIRTQQPNLTTNPNVMHLANFLYQTSQNPLQSRYILQQRGAHPSAYTEMFRTPTIQIYPRHITCHDFRRLNRQLSTCTPHLINQSALFGRMNSIYHTVGFSVFYTIRFGVDDPRTADDGAVDSLGTPD